MSTAALIKCQKCLAEIDDGDVLENSTVKCFLCSSRFHNKCRNITNELNDLIKARKIFIICDQCEIKFALIVTSSSGLESSHKRVNIPKDNIPKNNAHSARKTEMCRFYLFGYCKYGDKCSFVHTKFCWNIIRTGNCLDLCVNRRFHEHVCEDSKVSRMCLNLECEKYHIAGTRRVERFIDTDP